MNTIGQRIKRKRKEMNLTMKDIQSITGISTGNMSDLENDKYMPSVVALQSISKVLSVSIDWLVNGQEYQISEDVCGTSKPVSSDDLELLAKFHELTEKEQIKIEGMIEGMLMSRETIRQPGKQSRSKNIGDREEAAASETA